MFARARSRRSTFSRYCWKRTVAKASLSVRGGFTLSDERFSGRAESPGPLVWRES